MNCADSLPLTTAMDGRARILCAARDLFMQNGYTAVSMQQIADAATVNKATLYHHFADKEALFVEVLRQVFEQSRRRMIAAAEGGGSLRKQLLRLAREIVAGSSTNDIGRLMADLREHVSHERRTELMTQTPPPWDCFQSVFERARSEGEIRDIDPSLAGRLFFAMIATQLGWAKFGGPAHPDEETIATVVDVLLNGIQLHPDGFAVTATPAATAR